MKYILTEKELDIPEGITVTVKSREVTIQGTSRQALQVLQAHPLRPQKGQRRQNQEGEAALPDLDAEAKADSRLGHR